MPTMAISLVLVDRVLNMLDLNGDASINSRLFLSDLSASSPNKESELGPNDMALNCSLGLISSFSLMEETIPWETEVQSTGRTSICLTTH